MRYIALLRAVNVGGTGKLAMADLRAMCFEAGFVGVRTYIASGNVVFESALAEGEVVAALEARLKAFAGRPVGVMVRSAGEMAAVLARNPFTKAPGNQVGVLFGPRASEVGEVRGQGREQMEASGREVFVWFPDGTGRSKLKLPGMAVGTMRNINTVARLVEMSAQD